jgi:hypothetical protein
MRALWRTIALMSENADGFNQTLDTMAAQQTQPELIASLKLSNTADAKSVNLQLQPDRTALNNIDQFLRGHGLILCAYELSEVNRVACEARSLTPHHRDLINYWAGLGPEAAQHRNDPGFMEAVGAMAVDSYTRKNFALGNVSLTKWFPSLTPPQETLLRNAFAAGSPSDMAADDYIEASWPTACGSVTDAFDPSWIHVNL